MAALTTPRAPRRAYVDWLRGLAVLCMVLWHVIDSWHVAAGRDTSAFAVVVFFAGWAAPMFLFLAGLSLPLAGQAQLSKGRRRSDVVLALVRRGWLVFLLAHLFRFQSFLLSPSSAWNGLLKPDILNVLGLGLVIAALAWGRATSARARVWWLLVPAIVIAFIVTPWARDWWWPSLLHPRLEGYLRIVGGNAVFSLFPAVAYVLAGAFIGSLLAEAPAERERSVLVRFGVVGGVLLAMTIGSSFVPLSPAVHGWTTHGVIVVLRIGAMLLAMAIVGRILLRFPIGGSDPMLVLGRASLIVYWVHVELAYGNVSYPLHRTLSLPGALIGYTTMMTAMYVVARWWIGRPSGLPLVPPHMTASYSGHSPIRLRSASVRSRRTPSGRQP